MYADDEAMVPRHTSVLVQRRPVMGRGVPTFLRLIQEDERARQMAEQAAQQQPPTPTAPHTAPSASASAMPAAGGAAGGVDGASK